MINSFLKLGSVSGAGNLIQCLKLKDELAIKISAKNSKESRHEKLKQITVITRLNYSEQCAIVLVFKILQSALNMLDILL